MLITLPKIRLQAINERDLIYDISEDLPELKVRGKQLYRSIKCHMKSVM